MRPPTAEELLALHGRVLYSVAFRYLGNAQDAEDAVCDALLKSITHWPDGLEVEKCRSGLLQILRQECAARARMAGRLQLQEFNLELLRSADGASDGNELEAAVLQALVHIRLEWREAVILYDLLHLGRRDASLLLGITIPAFKRRLYRGRRALRALLGPSWVSVAPFGEEKHYPPVMAKTAIEVAQHYVDLKVHESPPESNRSPDIDKFERHVGVLGAAWCAAFATYCFFEAGQNPPFASASSQAILRWFRGKLLVSENPQDLLKWQGALFVWTDHPDIAHGHVGLIKNRFTDKHGVVQGVGTLEGNVHATGIKDGGGCHELRRSVPVDGSHKLYFCDCSLIPGGSWWA